MLTRLNTAMVAQQVSLFLTAVQATFRLTPAGLSGRLCLAGHPPALIRRAYGGPEPAQPVFDEAALARTLAGTPGLDAAAAGHSAATLAAHHGGGASDDTALLALRVPTA